MIFDSSGLLKLHYFLHLGGIYRAPLEDESGWDDRGYCYDLISQGSGAQVRIYNKFTGETINRSFCRTNVAKKFLTNTYKSLNNI